MREYGRLLKMINVGEFSPLVYEMRISADELDTILYALKQIPEKKRYLTNVHEKLIKNYEKLTAIRNVDGLRRYGLMDASRNNWKS